MKERAELKHLIPWLRRACDENSFPGLLGWINKEEGTFFVTWVHKSSENWEKSNSEVFEAWAEYKKKLGGKNDRDLKAAFRNALRSKKNNLKEISKSRNKRIWKIISDSDSTASTSKVRKIKTRKTNKNVCIYASTSTTSSSLHSTSSVCSTISYDSVMPNDVPLPSYETLFHVSPPTPPKQNTDVYLETLASKEEFFYLQEEILNLVQPSSISDIYRVPSPVVLPDSPTTSVSFFDVFSEVDKNISQTMDSVECQPNSDLDFLSLNPFNGRKEEQIVPNNQQELFNQINFPQNEFSRENEIHHTNQQLLEENFHKFNHLYTW